MKIDKITIMLSSEGKTYEADLSGADIGLLVDVISTVIPSGVINVREKKGAK